MTGSGQRLEVVVDVTIAGFELELDGDGVTDVELELELDTRTGMELELDTRTGMELELVKMSADCELEDIVEFLLGCLTDDMALVLIFRDVGEIWEKGWRVGKVYSKIWVM